MNCYIALAVKYQIIAHRLWHVAEQVLALYCLQKFLVVPCTKDVHTPTDVGKTRNETKRNRAAM